MAQQTDWDAIGALAEGVKQGLLTYKDIKKDQEKKALNERSLKLQLGVHGYKEGGTGELELTAPEAEKRKNEGLLKRDEQNFKMFDKGIQKKSDGGFEYTPEGQEDRYIQNLSKTQNIQTQGLMLPAILGSYQNQGAVKGGKADVDAKYKTGQLENMNKTASRLDKALGIQAQRYGYENKEAPTGFLKTQAQTDKEAADLAKTKAQTDAAEAAAWKSKHPGAGKTAAPKKNQLDAASYGKRMEQANSIMENLDSKGDDRSGVLESAQAMLPDWTGLKPGTLKQREQAERNFLNAVLRRESGAVISPSEFESGAKQYFNRRGDDPDTKAQKAQNRAQSILSLKIEAGPVWGMSQSVPLKKPGGLLGKQGVSPTSGKIKVSNGRETLLIDASDLNHAAQDGFNQVK